MPRLTELTPALMDDVQREIYDACVRGRRGTTPGNVLVWLRSPDLANLAQQLGVFVRYETTLGQRLSELAILIVAREWNSPYEWAVHRAEALKAGLSVDVIEAIAARKSPPVSDGKEKIVYDFCTALVATRAVPDAIYSAAVAALGERAIVELVGLLGYYTMVAMTLNTFEIDPPDGSVPLPP